MVGIDLDKISNAMHSFGGSWCYLYVETGVYFWLQGLYSFINPMASMSMVGILKASKGMSTWNNTVPHRYPS